MRTLSDVLHTLAVNEYDIPGFLHKQGIRGYPDDCGACPVAVYVSRETGAVDVDVQTWSTVVEYCDGTEDVADNPPAVAEFIRSFDNGEFPQLVAAA